MKTRKSGFYPLQVQNNPVLDDFHNLPAFTIGQDLTQQPINEAQLSNNRSVKIVETKFCEVEYGTNLRNYARTRYQKTKDSNLLLIISRQ